MERNTVELIIFVIYLLCMLGIGVYFFIKTKTGGDKEYFLGGRQMGAHGSRLFPPARPT